MPYKFDKNNDIPWTLELAIEILYNSANKEEINYIRENGATSLHHDLGQAIRNNWGLWSGSVLQDHFKHVYGLGHADDMSGLILHGLENRCADLAYDENMCVEIEKYKKHWRNNGVDPLTQEKL